MKFGKFSATITRLAILGTVALSACSAETGELSEDGILEEATEDSIPGDLSDKAGDSYVQWCNAPGADGTICRQQGCTGDACYSRELAAIAECRDEVRRICGGATQPWYIVFKADGYRWRLY